MCLIDTHSHYNLPAFSSDWEDVLQASRDAGVTKFLCPAISYGTNGEMLSMFEDVDDVSVALGIHPKRVCPRPSRKARRREPKPARMRDLRKRLAERLELLDGLDEQIASLGEMADASRGKVVAVGETGLDWSLSPDGFEREVQVATFVAQLELSLRKGLPVVLHVRDAHQDAINVLHRYRGAVRGVVHCFAAGPDEAKAYLSMGLLLGIGGKVTHAGCDGVREAVRIAPADRLVLETDAPYVVPSGFGSDRNDSTAIPMIARTVAEVRGISVEEVAETTTRNALRLFWGK